MIGIYRYKFKIFHYNKSILINKLSNTSINEINSKIKREKRQAILNMLGCSCILGFVIYGSTTLKNYKERDIVNNKKILEYEKLLNELNDDKWKNDLLISLKKSKSENQLSIITSAITTLVSKVHESENSEVELAALSTLTDETVTLENKKLTADTKLISPQDKKDSKAASNSNVGRII
mmetsp:Transcript_6910/g.6208  ORF Transcript_6910/g.6208 Transcript_6910/m.6208 type:complete len:179 (+) Transcript_6910:31-567(+)